MKNTDSQLLPKSIELRCLDNMQNGLNIEDAVTLAFEQEQDTIISMLNGSYLSKKGHFVADVMIKEIYPKLREK